MIKLINDMEAVKIFGVSTPNSRVILYNETPVGIIDFYVAHNYVKIMYITVSDEYRRKGIAAEVINMLKNNHQGKFMYGDSVPGALRFWESMGAEFDEDPDEDYLTPFHIEC